MFVFSIDFDQISDFDFDLIPNSSRMHDLELLLEGQNRKWFINGTHVVIFVPLGNSDGLFHLGC